MHLLRLHVLWRRVLIGLAALAFFALCVLLGALLPQGSAGASSTWVDDGGGTSFSCGYQADGSCGSAGGTAVIPGGTTLAMSSGDDSSGDDVELAISVSGPDAASDDCGTSSASAGTLAVPAEVTLFGSGASSCTLSAGDTATIEEVDYGPYDPGTGADIGDPFTPAVAVDGLEYFGGTPTGGGGGGGGSAGLSSAFVSEDGALSEYVGLGAALVVALMGVGLGVRMLVKYSKRAVSAQ